MKNHHIPVEPETFAALTAPGPERLGVLVVPASDEYQQGDTVVAFCGEQAVERRLTHILTAAPWLPTGHVALSIIDADVLVIGNFRPYLRPRPSVFPGPVPGPWFQLSGRAGHVLIYNQVPIGGEFIAEVSERNGSLVVSAPELADACRRAYVEARAGQLLSQETITLLRAALERVSNSAGNGLAPEIPPPDKPTLYSISLFGRGSERFLVILSEPGYENRWVRQGYRDLGRILVEGAWNDQELGVFDQVWQLASEDAPKRSRRKVVVSEEA